MSVPSGADHHRFVFFFSPGSIFCPNGWAKWRPMVWFGQYPQLNQPCFYFSITRFSFGSIDAVEVLLVEMHLFASIFPGISCSFARLYRNNTHRKINLSKGTGIWWFSLYYSGRHSFNRASIMDHKFLVNDFAEIFFGHGYAVTQTWYSYSITTNNKQRLNLYIGLSDTFWKKK